MITPVATGVLAPDDRATSTERARAAVKQGAFRLAPWVLVGAVYVALSVAAYGPVGPFDDSRVPSCGCGDVTYQIWFIAWTAHVLAHMLNPFFTTAVNYPFGVNVATNPSTPLLEFIVTPITWIFGPVASFNLLLHLSLASSAFAMYFVLCRMGIRRISAFTGGLLYGFSAYQQAHATEWINLSFVVLFPLLLYLFERLWRSPRHPVRLGIGLGMLAGAQYFISAELLLDAAFVLFIATVTAVVVRPSFVKSAWPTIGIGGAWALVSFAVVVIAPITFMLEGPEHFNGPAYPIPFLSMFSNDLLGPIVPTTYQALGPSNLTRLGTRFIAIAPMDTGLYLGLPLLLAVVVFAVVRRHRRLVAMSAWLAISAYVLSLGPRLRVDGHATHFPLPFALIDHLSVAQMAAAARFELFVQLFVSLIFASALDELVGRARTSTAVITVRLARLQRWLPVAVGVLAVLIIAPLVPRWPIPSAPVAIPALFTDGLARFPPGTVVLAYPYPEAQDDRAMLWQAETGFRFNLLGGYLYTPLHTDVTLWNQGGGGFVPRTLVPQAMQVLLYESYAIAPGYRFPGNDLGLERAFLRRYDVGGIVVDPVGEHPKKLVDYLARALRTRPQGDGRLLFWLGVQKDLLRIHRSNQPRVPAKA